ncbi:MAG: molybdopterin cofactor-binding domain-containing protein [Ottowia sp.]
MNNVRLVTGDTAEFYWGAGTFASRGAVVAGNAIHAAAVAVRKKVLKHASDALEVDEEDLELVDGAVQVKGAPHTAIKLGDLAAAGQPAARRGQAGRRSQGWKPPTTLAPNAGPRLQRRPRHDRRGGPGNDAGGDQALCCRPRLRAW